MENQHRKITGYRDLTQSEIDTMNAIKAKCAEVGALVKSIKEEGSADPRWLAIAATDLQKGFMFLTRAIAKPTDGF